MMLHSTIKRADALKPWFVFRSAISGQYVSRLFALIYPRETVKERRWK